MKLKILDKTGKETGSKDLPSQFSESFRPDLIKKAALAVQIANRQKYGSDPRAGKRSSAFVSKRRHNYKGTYGIGQSRTPRKSLSSRGTRFNWVGAFVPQTVGGYRAHPPKTEKVWDIKVNTKERRKAIRSAIAATINLDVVKARYNLVPENYPFILSSDFEKISKTKDVKNALMSLKLANELKRAKKSKIRSGIGKLRGRKKITKKSLLFVVSDECNLMKSAKNLPGIDIVKVNDLNALLLAPGLNAGRLTLFTDAAIDKLSKNKFFTNNVVKENKK
jgi:large subunit ribosomal protein L4e